MESESYSLKSIRYAYFLRHHRLIRPRVRSLDDFGRSLRQRSRVLYLLMTSFFPRDGIESSLLAISKSLSPWGDGTKPFCRTTKCSRYRLGELQDLLTNSFFRIFDMMSDRLIQRDKIRRSSNHTRKHWQLFRTLRNPTTYINIFL